MSKRMISTISATAIGCLGLGAFAGTGFGSDPAPAPTPISHSRIVSAQVEVASAPAAASSARKPPEHQRGKRRKHKDPKVTNLITTNPVAVPAGAETVAKLTCPRNKGIPLSGGAISPPAPASVAISVISRFSPNPPYKAESHIYYVGVRNTGVTAEEFRGTLVCAKGIDEAG